MRKGEQIKTHSHAKNNYSYLSGHICVHTENTNTHYIAPYFINEFSSKNELGKITLFPSWLRHYTDEVNTDLRITIAFDIIEEESFNSNLKQLECDFTDYTPQVQTLGSIMDQNQASSNPIKPTTHGERRNNLSTEETLEQLKKESSAIRPKSS